MVTYRPLDVRGKILRAGCFFSQGPLLPSAIAASMRLTLFPFLAGFLATRWPWTSRKKLQNTPLVPPLICAPPFSSLPSETKALRFKPPQLLVITASDVLVSSSCVLDGGVFRVSSTALEIRLSCYFENLFRWRAILRQKRIAGPNAR